MSEQTTERGVHVDFNAHDAEDCNACSTLVDICPYHRGVNVGFQMAVRKLTAWAEGAE